ncbi:MAG TPA: pyridoxamine 5'-phosphate oxidase [Stellaceae bacterium]|jgi:pyridoxamine 5'-phosphate oxidase|nr:pyridoxamine 5'-phosphate oxidase [Stellaceae bacterium]
MIDHEIAEDEPFTPFGRWFALADKSEPLAETMMLATATRDGRPSVRAVLLKGVDTRGFVFYTNLESRKGDELHANPRAALCFHWKSLARQVRVEGTVSAASDAEADAYFASRARESRLGAWASDQSRPLAERAELERRLATVEQRYRGLADVPRPENWSGFRVSPETIEFWQDRPSRLHDRIVFHREGVAWRKQRLYP